MTMAQTVIGRQWADERGAVHVYEAREDVRGRCLAWARPTGSSGAWQVRDLRGLMPQTPAGSRPPADRLVSVEEVTDRRTAVSRLDVLTEGWS